MPQSPPGSFRVLVRASMPLELASSAGGPAEVWLDIASPAGDDRLLFDVLWVNKTATRLPEVRARHPVTHQTLRPSTQDNMLWVNETATRLAEVRARRTCLFLSVNLKSADPTSCARATVGGSQRGVGPAGGVGGLPALGGDRRPRQLAHAQAGAARVAAGRHPQRQPGHARCGRRWRGRNGRGAACVGAAADPVSSRAHGAAHAPLMRSDASSMVGCSAHRQGCEQGWVCPPKEP